MPITFDENGAIVLHDPEAIQCPIDPQDDNRCEACE